MYHENGVIIVPNVVVKGDKAKVLYNGVLKNTGANPIYLQVGFGDTWNETQGIEMRKGDEGFEAEIPIKSDEQLKLAFRDSNNLWDNNNGKSYSFEVQGRL
jgi:hypothetical protein